MAGFTRDKTKLEGAIRQLVRKFEEDTGAHVVEIHYNRQPPRRAGELQPLLSVAVDARVPDGDDRQRDMFGGVPGSAPPAAE